VVHAGAVLAVTHGCGGLPFVIVRFHNVYGPRMGMEHVIPELLQRALSRENPLTVFNLITDKRFVMSTTQSTRSRHV
jgi:nucleoside-diphosphate-sugar epimerase